MDTKQTVTTTAPVVARVGSVGVWRVSGQTRLRTTEGEASR